VAGLSVMPVLGIDGFLMRNQLIITMMHHFGHESAAEEPRNPIQHHAGQKFCFLLSSEVNIGPENGNSSRDGQSTSGEPGAARDRDNVPTCFPADMPIQAP